MESSKSTKPKPSKFKRSFLYKLFHRKKVSSDQEIDDKVDRSMVGDGLSSNEHPVPESDDQDGAAVLEVVSENCLPSQVPAAVEASSESLSRASHATSSSDSIKRARELFFEPLISKSGSDSGCPDEEKKQDTDPNSQEEFIRISSHTFRQLQNEVKFLRDQLATLHNLFCTDYEVKTDNQETNENIRNVTSFDLKELGESFINELL